MVAPADLEAVDAELARRLVAQALHVVVRLRPARAAVRRHRRRVGEHRLRRHLEERDLVDAADVAHRVHRRRLRRHRADPRADVAVAGDSQREEHGVLVERQLDRHLVVARMLIRQERPGALVGPLHRPSQRPRRVREAHVLRVDGALHAERAADVRRDHAHAFLLYAEDVGELVALREDALALAGQRESPALVLAQRRARLHRRDDDPGVPQRQPGYMGCLGKGRRHLLRLAPEEVELHVAWHVVVELRRAGLRRRARGGHRRQRLDVELHRLGCVLRLHRRRRHHARHRVAHVAHLVRGERLAHRPLHRRAVAHLEVEHALVRPVRRQVLRRVDREHARHAPRGLGVDPLDHAVRVRAPHDRGVRLPGLVHVVGVAAFAAEEGGIFGASDALADASGSHRPIIAERKPASDRDFARQRIG